MGTFGKIRNQYNEHGMFKNTLKKCKQRFSLFKIFVNILKLI